MFILQSQGHFFVFHRTFAIFLEEFLSFC